MLLSITLAYPDPTETNCSISMNNSNATIVFFEHKTHRNTNTFTVLKGNTAYKPSIIVIN